MPLPQSSVFKVVKTLVRRYAPSRLRQWLRKLYYPHVLHRFTQDQWPAIAVVKQLVKPGDHVVDAGANVGYVTMLLSRIVGPGGKVSSFEPVPETFDVLRHNVRVLKLSNVEPLPYGLSDRNRAGRMEIPEHPDGGLNFYEGRVTDAASRPATRGVPVELRALDSLLPDGRVAFMKIDVEGHELAVVRGAVGLLNRCRPALMIEISGDPLAGTGPAREMFGILRDLQYAAFRIGGGPALPAGGGPDWGDYMFLTAEQAGPAQIRSHLTSVESLRT